MRELRMRGGSTLVLALLLLAGRVYAGDEATLPPDRIEAFLKTGKIVAAAPIGKGVTKPWRLTLTDGMITHDAAFQSVDRAKEQVRFKGGREERGFRDYYGYNIAAYRLARLLGYDDLVPVSVERRWRGNSGALTWWVNKKWDEDERIRARIEPPDKVAWERQLYLGRAFTALVEDTDRNLGNQLVTADFHMWLIDFTRAFRRSPHLVNPATLRRVDRKFYERLRRLSDEEITLAVKRWVASPNLNALLSRRKAMVAHFDKLVAERGEESVFFEETLMSPVVHEAINRQINAELSASYAYLAMSAFCSRQAFHGCAKWLRLQSQEEYGHAMRLFDFQIARDGTVELKGIVEPTANHKSIAAVFEAALEQEQEVSGQIDVLYELAFKERAYAALVELQWFLTEQVEEERSARDIVAKFKLVGSDPSSLLDLDRELGTRSTV